MSGLQLIGREAWNEFRFGLKSGVILLIFVGLTAYLVMVLTNAGYLQDMGATEVPRNAPSLVYLMTAGDAFFLFFAWAWVFAQPLVRDRQALLHEVVLAAPVSLRALLIGRYLGALAVALLLGISQMLGFLLAPLLEALALVPPGSVGPTPWVALAWAFLVFTLPTAAGTGALYFIAAIKTRSTGGPFAVSAVLIFIWMFAMIVMSESGANTTLATVLDPSCFADVNLLNLSWTPVEKATILYPLSESLLLNRLLWFVLPLVLLAMTLVRTSREQLVMDRPMAGASVALLLLPPGTSRYNRLPSPDCNWWRAFLAESAWQHALLLKSRTFQIVLLAMVLLGIAAAFVHGVNHVDGPFEARPEVIGPLLAEVLYLVIAFIAAALVGHVLRRDHRAGMMEMLDAAPAPVLVSLLGRLTAVLTLAVLLLLTPALAGMITTLLSAPHAFNLVTPFIYQLAVYGPGLLELVACVVFLHCLIRRSGPAHAAAMLATFIFVVNHEAKLITYPPMEFGIPAAVSYSVLSGWAPWSERLLTGDAYKLACIALLLACAALVQARGLDGRMQHGARQLRMKLQGPVSMALAASIVATLLLYQALDREFVTQGGYLGRDAQLDADAEWEQRWMSQTAPYAVEGGELALDIDTQARRVIGEWRLNGVVTTGDALHLELPEWLILATATIQDTEVNPLIIADHAAVPLGACASGGCKVVLRFLVEPRGWSTAGEQQWLMQAGIWADAARLAPTLGFDQDRRVLAPVERELRELPSNIPEPERQVLKAVAGIAPAGTWQVRVNVDDAVYLDTTINGPLDFVVQKSVQASPATFDGLAVVADRTRTSQAALVAEDARTMLACVERRLGAVPVLDTIAQLPRGMGQSVFASGTLLLAEDPYWDIGDTGTGRWQRQAAIASLLAQRVVVDAGDLRQGRGSRALVLGVAGAIGHLCVGDNNGTQALQTLLVRKAERITQALAGAGSPVIDVMKDVPDAWLDEYTATANISWVAQASASDLQRLLADLKQRGEAVSALAGLLGTESEQILGKPSSSDLAFDGAQNELRIRRENWVAGGWVPAPDGLSALQLLPVEKLLGIRRISELSPEISKNSLLLDAAPGYERTAEDNLVP